VNFLEFQTERYTPIFENHLLGISVPFHFATRISEFVGCVVPISECLQFSGPPLQGIHLVGEQREKCRLPAPGSLLFGRSSNFCAASKLNAWKRLCHSTTTHTRHFACAFFKVCDKKNCEGAVGLLSLIAAEEFNMPPLFSEMGKIDYNGQFPL